MIIETIYGKMQKQKHLINSYLEVQQDFLDVAFLLSFHNLEQFMTCLNKKRTSHAFDKLEVSVPKNRHQSISGTGIWFPMHLVS